MKYSTAENLRTIMKRKNVTMTKLAEELGQSRQNVSKKFKRDNFNEKDLKEISEVLNVKYEITFKDK